MIRPYLQTIRASAFLLAWMVFPFWALAQQVAIAGQVKDAQSGNPLIAATVAIPSDKAGGYTDENGRFSFRIQKRDRDSVTVIFSFSGYSRQELTISLDANQRNLNVELIPEGYTADDVVITASKGFQQRQKDVTVSVEVVKSEYIDLQTTSDITAVLQQVPGVNIMENQVNIRGSSGFGFGVGSRVMVMLNNLPMITGDAGIAEFSILPVDNIARVEVIKSSSSVLYGSSSLGGVINVVTDDPPEKPETVVRYRLGIYDQPKNKALDWDGSSAAYSTSLHAYHGRRLGDFDFSVHTDLIRDSGYRKGTSRSEGRFFLMTRWHPKKVSGLSIGLNASVRIDSSGAFVFWRGYHPDTTVVVTAMDTSQFITGGALTPTTGEGGSRTQFLQRYALDPDIRFVTPDGKLFQYRGRLFRTITENSARQGSNNFLFFNDLFFQTTVLEKLNWTVGLMYTYNQVFSDELYAGEFDNGEDTVRSDGSVIGREMGAYTQIDGKFGRLTISAGARIHSAKIAWAERETRPVFSAGVNYAVNGQLNLRASFGQGFRVPLATERFISTQAGGVVVDPNPNIKSEFGYSAEVGARQGFKLSRNGNFTGFVDMAVFIRRFYEMVEYGVVTRDLSSFPPDIRFATTNVADARIPGGELSFGMFGTWRSWRLSFNGGVTYVYPENLNAVPEEQQMDVINNGVVDFLNPNKIDAPKILKYRPRWVSQASMTVGFQRIALTTNFRLRSYIESFDQYLYLNSPGLVEFREKYPNGDQVFDFIFSYDVNQHVQLSFNLSNAFNEEYLAYPVSLAEQRKLTMQFVGRF